MFGLEHPWFTWQAAHLVAMRLRQAAFSQELCATAFYPGRLALHWPDLKMRECTSEMLVAKLGQLPEPCSSVDLKAVPL